MHYPRAFAWWERLAWWRVRRCAACGLKWKCDEGVRDRLRKQALLRNDLTGAWWPVVRSDDWPTAAYEQIGRAGNMTPAQLRRAQGGQPS